MTFDWTKLAKVASIFPSFFSKKPGDNQPIIILDSPENKMVCGYDHEKTCDVNCGGNPRCWKDNNNKRG